MKELVDLVRGDVGQDAAEGVAVEEPGGRIARFSRCGPSPTVWITRPIAPSATSREAASQARTTKRSEKQIEKMRPVSRRDPLDRGDLVEAWWRPACRPSRPCRRAWRGWRWRAGRAGSRRRQTMSMDGSSNRRSRGRAQLGEALAEARPARADRWSRAVAGAFRAGRDQFAHHVEDVAVVEPDGGEAEQGGHAPPWSARRCDPVSISASIRRCTFSASSPVTRGSRPRGSRRRNRP
jgi:hypothetical protein